jgi:membrane protease YdiL (CAAX protease family)
VLHEIHGLPAHILLVHAVVVLLPLAAVLLVASAAWPAARRRIGVVGPVLALIVLVLVPITTSQIDPQHLNPAIEHHAALAHGLLPWAIGLFVVSSGVWVLARRYEFGWRPEPAPGPNAPAGAVATKQTTVLPVWVTALVVVVATVVAVGAVVDVIRIGDAGSQAVWRGVLHH